MSSSDRVMPAFKLGLQHLQAFPPSLSPLLLFLHSVKVVESCGKVGLVRFKHDIVSPASLQT